MRWLQDPNQIRVDNLNNARGEASRHFRKEKYINLKCNEKKLSVITQSEIFMEAA